MSKTRLEKLVEKKKLLDLEIEIEIGNLNNYMNQCECEENTVKVEVSNEGATEVITYCSKCGGLA